MRHFANFNLPASLALGGLGLGAGLLAPLGISALRKRSPDDQKMYDKAEGYYDDLDAKLVKKYDSRFQTKYQNEFLDKANKYKNTSGVQGVYDRDVNRLNTATSVGLGLGATGLAGGLLLGREIN